MSLQWSWRELERLAEWIRPEIEGAFVEKVFIPARPEHPDGYLKNEWAIRLSQKDRGSVLLFSVRPQEVYVDLHTESRLKAAGAASHSGFDLLLQKTLPGLKLEEIETTPGDRRVILWFSGEGRRYGLFLQFIPAMPEAVFFEETGTGDWIALSRSKQKEALETWTKASVTRDTPTKLEPGSRLPGDTVRTEIFGSLKTYQGFLRRSLQRAFLRLKLQSETKRKAGELKKLEQNLRTAETQEAKAESEPDYARFGILLKSQLYLFQGEQAKEHPWTNPLPLTDWESGETVQIPVDPTLTPKNQLEKFYWLEKRKKRRMEESSGRIREFRERVERWQKELDALRKFALAIEKEGADLLELSGAIEKVLTSPATAAPSGLKEKEKGKLLEFGGKTYVSKEGLAILVGRNKKENLELTLKIARGNDLWFHLKGRPGSHVVVLLRDRKSASLETMLDASYLCVFYSGGKDWGKTEVDYTYRKFVKRIKDSDEVSYTQNKTLAITLDRERLQKLLDQ